MTLAERVARLGRVVTTVTWVDAAAVGVAVGAGVRLAGAIADRLGALPDPARAAVAPSAVALGALVAGWRLARGSILPGRSDVALWLEARLPALRFALLSALDPSVPESARARCAARAGGADLEGATRRAVRPVLLRAAVLLAVAAMAATARLHASGGGTGSRGDVGSRLVSPGAGNATLRLVLRVEPPTYLGGRVSVIEDPAAVAAFPGSRVTVLGDAAPVGLTARVGDAVLPVRVGSDGRWTTAFSMPGGPTLFRAGDGRRDRLVVVEPRVDSAPRVTLRAPERDSTLRAVSGAVEVVAEARDDHGLADLAVEYIVTSGSGERFEARADRVTGTPVVGVAAVRRLRLPLESLGLGPGDVLHVRAVATDRNDVSGPGVGVSETRALRIARADEYDSVAVDPVPPPESEADALSQRMLLVRTEALVRAVPSLERQVVRREAGAIGRDQRRLRQRVGQLVFERLEGEGGAEHAHFPGDGHDHGADQRVSPDQVLRGALGQQPGRPPVLDFDGDESPVVRINRPLLEAFNHMWDAATALELAEPAAALAPMRRALEALQRARAAERIYLRGRPPTVVVDVTRVRLTGRGTGAAGPRTPRPPDDPFAAARLARFDRALTLFGRDAAAALDSLTVLRVDLLAAVPRAAAALGDATAIGRRGGDVTAPLIAVRRLLAGPPRRGDGFGPAGVVW